MSGVSRGHEILAEGSRLYGRGARIVGSEGPTPEAESALRSALHTLRSAMNWLEDTADFEIAHARLDAAGRLARENFKKGCRLTLRDGQYWQECPAALAHNRVGLSPGYVIRKAECCICHSDPGNCNHITGREYDGEVCVRLITEADLLEVSLVGRPAQPDARLTGMSVSLNELQDRLGDRFRPGTPVTCDNCLLTCEGVARPFEGSGHGDYSPPASALSTDHSAQP